MNQIKNTKDLKTEYCFPSYETSEIKEAFDCFDVNHKGYIGVMELKEIFSIIQEEVSDEEMDEMIKMADKEGDGQVNWLNFFEFITGNGIDQEISKLNNNNIDSSFKNNEVSNNHYQMIGEKTLKKPDSLKKTQNNDSVIPINATSADNNSGSSHHQINIPHKKQLVIKRQSQSQETNSGNGNSKTTNNFEVMSNNNNSNFLKPNRGHSQEDEFSIKTNGQLKENFISSMMRKNQSKQKQFEILDIDNKPKRNMIVLKPSPFENKEQEVKEEERELKADIAEIKVKLFKTNTPKDDNREEQEDRSSSNDNDSGAFKENTSGIDKEEPFIDEIQKDRKDKDNNHSYAEHIKEIQNKIHPHENERLISHRSRFNNNLLAVDNQKKDLNKFLLNTKTISVRSKASVRNSSHDESEIDEKQSQVIKDDDDEKNLNLNSKDTNAIVITPPINNKQQEKEDISDKNTKSNYSDKNIIRDSVISKMDLEEEEKRIKKEQEIEELAYYSNENEVNKINSESNNIDNSIKAKPKGFIIESLEEQKNRIQASTINKQLKRELDKENSLKQQKEIDSMNTNEDNNKSLKSNKQSGSSGIIIETIPLINQLNNLQNTNEPSFHHTNNENENESEDNSPINIEQDRELNFISNDNNNDNKNNNKLTLSTVKYPINNLIKDHQSSRKGTNKEDDSNKTKQKEGKEKAEEEEEESNRIFRKSPLSKTKEIIEHANPIQKQNNQIKKDDSEFIFGNNEDSNQNTVSNKSSIQSHESKRKAQLVPKGAFPKIKKDIIKKFIQKEQITPSILKSFYSKFETLSCLHNLVLYEEFLKLYEFTDSEEAKDFFETFRTINSDNHSMSISDSLILLLNNTSLHKEEKFKFEFLCFDKDKSKFLSKEELTHLLELNFFSNTTNDINKKLQLIIDEIKKMNIYDTEVYDYDVLLEILKQKPNLFFPY